ncbi:hypothetical protein JKP88DRAFT_231280 [Tribonema minus]|uniref:Uncharacterized protein n=1 Tax=Tribonema minus TaxID=303371 RepID=A0A835ZHL2_9STRA|nr:hypothetical protein JKP88DRAFT_231280 [Tribonema minus]
MAKKRRNMKKERRATVIAARRPRPLDVMKTNIMVFCSADLQEWADRLTPTASVALHVVMVHGVSDLVQAVAQYTEQNMELGWVVLVPLSSGGQSRSVTQWCVDGPITNTRSSVSPFATLTRRLHILATQGAHVDGLMQQVINTAGSTIKRMCSYNVELENMPESVVTQQWQWGFVEHGFVQTKTTHSTSNSYTGNMSFAFRLPDV